MKSASIVHIRAAECIGCTKCIDACPFDAIIGASKQLHTIIENECTGCNLCIKPCPVDCIEIVAVAKPLYQIEKAKQRVLARKKRLVDQNISVNETLAILERKSYLQSALERVRAKKSNA